MGTAFAPLLDARLVPSNASGVTSLNSETGAINIVGGTNVTVTPSGQNITITASSTAATAFSALTTSTNTIAAMLVGTGASLGPTGTGTISANLLNGTSLGGLSTGLLKNTTSTGVPTIAVAGTDYQAPITLTTAGTSGAATFSGNTLNIPQYSGGSSGVSSFNTLTGAVVLAAGSNVSLSTSGNTITLSSSGGGGGSTSGRTVTSSSSVTMTTTDGIVNINLTTPAAVSVTTATTSAATPWLRQTIKDAAGNAQIYPITITPQSGTIDGNATYVIQSNHSSVDIYTDGTNWFTA